MRELILVPGHGICRSGATGPREADKDQSWIGIFPEEAALHVAHIERGVKLAAARADALLVFSGGQTRVKARGRSEAESYWEIARDHFWWGDPAVAERAVREEYARDSFENLLFALITYRLRCGRPPEKISVVGWRFKMARYDLHVRALGWRGSFEFHAVNDPPEAARDRALEGEEQKLSAARSDPCLTGDVWRNQRAQRNPFARRHPYRGVDPALDRFLVEGD